MKIEVKDLTPYLPYGLTFLMESEPNSKEPNIVELKSIDIVLKMVNFGWGNAKTFLEIKPILRPMSDLLKNEIEVNEHYINEFISEKHKVDYGIFSYYKGDIDIQLDGDINVQYDQNKTIPFNVIIDIQTELLKAHYDVFGLIEKGLAIDINKL